MIRVKQHPAPGQPCPGCAGRAFQFDEYNETFRPCPHCGAESTVGLFVIRLAGDGIEEERSWHTTDYLAAVRRARRIARTLGRFRPDTPVEAVRVVYLAPRRTPFEQRCTSCGGHQFGQAGQGDGTVVFLSHVLRVVARAGA